MESQNQKSRQRSVRDVYEYVQYLQQSVTCCAVLSPIQESCICTVAETNHYQSYTINIGGLASCQNFGLSMRRCLRAASQQETFVLWRCRTIESMQKICMSHISRTSIFAQCLFQNMLAPSAQMTITHCLKKCSLPLSEADNACQIPHLTGGVGWPRVCFTVYDEIQQM